MVYVTHDQAEATRIAARVALLEGGRILQIAPYETLRERPASQAVATRATLDQYAAVPGATVSLSIDPGALHLLPAAE